ncbi:Uncharacterised protein [Mycobacteroides abscessus subsp. massiliense]|nr:Uncharacterised protein [Mycobacteroides abscessus subsp. massiliense]
MSAADEPPPADAEACAVNANEATAIAPSAASATMNETADRMADRVNEVILVFMAVPSTVGKF